MIQVDITSNYQYSDLVTLLLPQAVTKEKQDELDGNISKILGRREYQEFLCNYVIEGKTPLGAVMDGDTCKFSVRATPPGKRQ